MNDKPLVRCTVADGIATLVLQHPSKPNPITMPLQRELLATLRRLHGDASLRAVVLTAAGRAFCVGADLEEMQQAEAENASLGAWTADFMAELTNPIVLSLRALPVPVVCAVNGAAAGAGAGLAMAGDVLLMGRSSYLYLPFIPRLGIIPDMGSTWLLPRRLGRQRAMALTLLGDRLPAQQAADWGVAWACVADETLADEALVVARRLAKLPPGAALEARRAFEAAERNDLAQQLEYERSRQRELIDQPAFREGVHAFLEKREPVFGPRG
jgi:2-(1,2-epoxy-1,2-dihydrophenyl)acetyl-CoA isomerase